MASLIVLFNLKPGVDPAEYERWAAEVDVPTVKSLSSVDDFTVHRVGGLLGSQDDPPYAYCEVIEVNDLERLGEEVTSEAMQEVAATFQGTYAQDPVFLVTERFA